MMFTKVLAHWAMWLEVVMSWNGRQKAVKLGSAPPGPSTTPTIQMRVPFVFSPVLAGAGGDRRPYCRVDEKVNQRTWRISSSCSMKGAHLGNEFVSAVAPLSPTPGLLALVKATGVAPLSDVRKIVAVMSVSASQDLSGAAPVFGVPLVQVDSS